MLGPLTYTGPCPNPEFGAFCPFVATTRLTCGDTGQRAPGDSCWRFSGFAMSGAQSICGGEGDGVGVVAGGNPGAATPAKVPGTHAPAGRMAKLVNAYPDGDGGRPVTGKLRSPED